MFKDNELDILFIVAAAVGITLVFSTAFLLFYINSIRVKNKILLEKQNSVLKMLKEIYKTKLEIQDSTLNNVGRELHDNIGQLLTVIKIHSNGILRQFPNEKRVIELNSVLEVAINELKSLSKSLNNSRVNDFGLHQELQNELSRIKKTNLLNAELKIVGNEKKLISDKAIILYRIIQEFLSNSLKYSNASEVIIVFEYFSDNLSVEINDNGIGFDIHKIKMGSGIMNIKNRATILHATKFELNSTIQVGTSLSITIPIN